MKKHILVLAALAGLVSIDALAESAGKVLALTGEASVVRGGQASKLSQGQSLESGDRVTVGATGNVQLRFTDDSIVMLRSGSEFNIDDYYFQKGEKGRSSFNLVRGGLRTITGLIGKTNRDGYSVKTPTSTIGIRGTHYVLQICNNDCFNRDGSPAPNGVYGAVTDGRIAVTNEAGTTEFGQQEYFRVANGQSAPEPLLAPPTFLAATSVVPLTDTGSGSAPTALATAAGGVDSAAAQTSGATGAAADGGAAQVTTSPASTALASPVLALPTDTTLVSTNALPGVVSGGGNIAIVESLDQKVLSGVYTPLQVEAMIRNETGIAGITTPQAMYNALVTYGTAGYSGANDTAAGVYWVYQVPDGTQTYDYGYHTAFGYAATNLPTSGTANYQYLGSTSPTISFDSTTSGVYSTGTFTGANLSVNFASMQATTLGAMTWSWSSVAATLAGNTTFSLNGTPTLSGLTCSGPCATSGATVSGTVGTQFYGAGGTGLATSFAFTFLDANSNPIAYGGNVVAYKKQ